MTKKKDPMVKAGIARKAAGMALDAAAELVGREVGELKAALAEIVYADDAVRLIVDPQALIASGEAERRLKRYDDAIVRARELAGLVRCPRCGTHVPILDFGDGKDRYTAHGPVEDGNDCPLSGALIP